MLAEKYLREAAPAIEPVAVEVPVAVEISGVKVRGIVDILDASGRIIDIKTSSRKPSKVSGDHAFQLATYTALLGPEASGETRLDLMLCRGVTFSGDRKSPSAPPPANRTSS
jgi:hypothetical protein